MTTQTLEKPNTAEDNLSWRAPLRIGRVSLVVRDAQRVSAFYREALGLQTIDTGGRVTRLGAGGKLLLELHEDRGARPRGRRDAGLFHTAFLLPSRGDLGRWIEHAGQTGVAVQGASDHLVSEAVYLADPEGNGVEIYADRPATEWRRVDGVIEMTTEHLEIEPIVAAGGGRKWSGMPAGGFVGHIHLQVGDVTAAEDFYSTALGFDLTYRVPGASFYSTGGYHHHLATNSWSSRGALVRAEGATGLKGFEIVATSDAAKDALRDHLARAGLTGPLKDPWGTAIDIVSA